MPISKDKVMDMFPLLRRKKFVVLDIETSGLSPDKGGRIIEIGAVLIVNGKIIDTFEQLINPQQKIYGKTTELTGITNEMLVGKPVIGQVLPKLHKFIGDAVIVAHNADFDWNRFLLFFFKKVGIIPDNELIDTLVFSKYFFPNKKKHGLEEFCSEFGVTIENHHRALDDTKATAESFLKMLETFKDEIEEMATKVEVEQAKKANEVQVEQFDLFGGIASAKEDKPVKLETKEDKLKVKRVKYWEKPIGKDKSYKRLYVSINDGTIFGNVYYDIPTKTWYNKDFPTSLDFERVHQLVLRFLNLNSTEELCVFRN